MRLFIYLSEMIGRKVLDEHNRTVGKLCDISMCLSEEVFPRAESLIISTGSFKKKYACISIDKFERLGKTLKLKKSVKAIKFQNKKFATEFSLSRDILDQQVVDTHDQKVVRVNDVHLLRVDNQIYLAHVDIGLRGLVRRLGWSNLVDGLIKSLAPDSPYLKEEELISWRNSQVLMLGRNKNVLRLNDAKKKMARIPPTQLAEIMEDLDIYEKLSLFKSFTVDLQRKVFTDMAPQEKEELIEQLSDKEAVNLIENIPADEAVDLLNKMPKEKTGNWMRLMHTATSKKLRKLLGFAQDSAGGLMTTEYLYLKREASVGDAIAKIKKFADYPGNIFYVYIIDDEHKLLGATSLRRFINEDLDKPLIDTCYPNRIFVRTDDEVEEIALLLEKYKFSSIPVLDDNDILQGVITSDDVLEELISLTWTKYKDQL
ncbi:MAG: magnesium transporter [Lysobacterales bacterium]|jgi:magnesium transporter